VLDASDQLLRDVGARVAELRRAKGLTQSELATQLGSSDKHLQRVEAGQENLTLRTLSGLAQALGVQVAALFRPPLATVRRRGRPSREVGHAAEPIRLAEASPRAMAGTLVPLLTLRARAGEADTLSSVGVADWVEVPGRRREPGLFVARVVGGSMAPRIPDGGLVLLRSRVRAPKSGDVVLVELDPTDDGGRYVLKRLGAPREAGEGRMRARLESLAPGHRPLLVELGEGAPARIVATLVDVLSATTR
jgi:transcriptional regulator with XRE-family HTH domain